MGHLISLEIQVHEKKTNYIVCFKTLILNQILLQIQP
jgi:hypothetical protein